jgi:uncharacterized protein (DUF1015 family)
VNYIQARFRLGQIHTELETQTVPREIITLLDEAVYCLTVMSKCLDAVYPVELAALRAEQLEENRDPTYR